MRVRAQDDGASEVEAFMLEWAREEFCWATCRLENDAPKTSIRLM